MQAYTCTMISVLALNYVIVVLKRGIHTSVHLLLVVGYEAMSCNSYRI